jgi:hypothetical protein
MAERSYTTNDAEIARLLSLGFSELEADRLVYMKEHLSEQVEYREMMEHNHRLNFIRWLIEHDRLSH